MVTGGADSALLLGFYQRQLMADGAGASSGCTVSWQKPFQEERYFSAGNGDGASSRRIVKPGNRKKGRSDLR